ncbi:dsDNA nuclease domain-containing protein [Burkholderia gladioli]|uniref:dsDNA nuclease domain-containing protein n=1 Tax=Burkholderia gladioli TaxID=28095 RepID=UPI00163FFCA4|nr:dsDNA nuclease domain-containing protein [Burkholderia gladioli]
MHAKSGDKAKRMDLIHDKKPRETVGRNTVARFRMQFQAAAYAALEILSGKEIDRVYCDYHDDFVVRRTVAGVVDYHFFQVKTKGKANQQWDVAEVFSLKKNGALDTEEKLDAIRNSIAGKLFVHTVEFGDQCREITVLSNVHFNDDVHDVVTDLSTGASSKKYIRQLIEKFAEIVSPESPLSSEQIEAARKKLSLLPNVQYIGDTLEAFSIAAHNAIWRHSEIELHQHEVERLARSLVTLVEEKSCSPISGLSKTDIDLATGVGLEDLLDVLSISTQVYQTLQQGGDPAAIKAASILQRKLKEAGATESMIEAASRAKVAWDVWVRSARHTFPDFTFNVLLDEIDQKCKAWLLGGGVLGDLENFIQVMLDSPIAKRFVALDTDLVFGAFCAAVVRRATR